jgi:hypothetical protein
MAACIAPLICAPEAVTSLAVNLRKSLPARATKPHRRFGDAASPSLSWKF